ncbi:MAG: class I SAM-dependent methyltransferase [Sulfurovum sp.]|nr:class I SAM-dependent methyltransferase [Sulfurovum sp.]MCB4745510.1 class I SAM-dependent methyltransferase [Sulfurovum sp.]MCB4745594.1 class I SAM-dependent methyltransferase [Sulfurovum sp.]MCB4749045.1 class I SAM-dependent methyltransferase [Sulfurovum sp.]MCB4750987.1 class I SAM-dependent methyltransferase [Sulfurovum sp.]
MRCHICQNKTMTFHDEKTSVTYYHCKPCEYIFKEPSCYQTIKKQKLRYDLHENNEEDGEYRAYFQRFLDFVIPLVGKPKNALDFGCGRSILLSNMLKFMHIDTDVYDPIYHPNTAWNTKQYELIVSTEVFEHLHDPGSIFEQLVERLVSNGYLAFQTQFHPNEVDAFKKWYYHKDPTHITFFRRKTFEALAQKYGCGYIADNGKNMIVLKKY